MKLLDGEKKLLESDNGNLLLTSHRIRYEESQVGQGEIRSILLDGLSFCGMTATSKPILAILAGTFFLLFIMAAMQGSRQEVLIILLALGIICAIIWAITRRQVLELASSGGVIRVNIKGMNKETVREFIDTVEAAKNSRGLLQSSSHHNS